MIQPIAPSIMLEDMKYVARACVSGNINDGPITRMLEEAVGKYHGCGCVCVSSGTSALEIIFRHTGYHNYTIPYCSHISTVAAAINAGAKRFECSKEPFITADLNGRHSHVGDISDACQSPFTRGVLKGRRAVALSFGALKSITGGTGGAVLSDNEHLLAFARAYKSYGRVSGAPDYWIARIGSNHKMSDINAALALAQWERHEEIIEDRWRIHNAYTALLGDMIQKRHNTEVPWLIDCLVSPEFAASSKFRPYHPQYGHYEILRGYITNWQEALAPVDMVFLPSHFNLPQSEVEKYAQMVMEANK
jgi:dTDP-4-amino-4,6-dideoxygalactose transaminase